MEYGNDTFQVQMTSDDLKQCKPLPLSVVLKQTKSYTCTFKTLLLLLHYTDTGLIRPGDNLDIEPWAGSLRIQF